MTPEDMMLSAETGEDTQDRANIEILVPWIKFLWDAYRNCLDLLRNNKPVERLYQDIAKLAMTFCVKYDRKNEFRRLSDTLRSHLNQITRGTKGKNAAVAISLQNPESQAIHLDIRISQLDFGIKIELWQEAFKAVEDIHYLMNIPKRQPHPGKLAEFYAKLGVVFMKANMHLFHACTRHKLFKLTRDMRKNLSQQELSTLASMMVLSTMSIPITTVKHGLGKMLDIENALVEKHQKMARLLELERTPTRGSLMSDMISRYGVLKIIPKQLVRLYELLETDEGSLKMKNEVEEILSWLENHSSERMREYYALYAQKIKGVMASRILIKVSKIYMTVKFPKLIKLLPDMSRQDVERMIVDASRIGQLRVRIDHSKDIINFGRDSDPAPLYVDDGVSTDPLTASREDTKNEWISNRLKDLSRVLEMAIIQLKSDEEEKLTIKRRTNNYAAYIKARSRESSRLKNRRDEIEERIEECETEVRERATREREKKARDKADKEKEIADKEKRDRDRLDALRKGEEQKAEQLRQAREKLESMRKSELGAKLFADLTAEMLLTVDLNELFQERVKKFKEIKREDQEKLKKVERSFDYYERAKRLAEIPKMEEYNREQAATTRVLMEEMEDVRMQQMRSDWENDLATKKRLSFMSTDASGFKDKLKRERRELYEKKKKAFDAELAAERKIRLEQRKQDRIAERREEWLEECRKEEIRRKEKEAEARRQKEIEAAEEERRREDARREAEENAAKMRRRSPPPRDDGRYRPPGGMDRRRSPSPGPWKRGGSPRRRSPPRRSPPRRGPSPDRRGPPMRSFGGRPRSPSPRGGGGGAWRRPGGSPGRRSPPRRFSPVRRDGPRRFSPPRRSPSPGRRPYSPPRRDGPAPRRFSPGRRSPPRRMSPGRGPPRRGFSPPRRGGSPPRRGGSPPRRRFSPPRNEGAWRPGPRDDRGPRDDPRGPPRRDGPPAWRNDDRDEPRDAPPRREPSPKRDAPPAEPDGWSTAVGKRRESPAGSLHPIQHIQGRKSA